MRGRGCRWIRRGWTGSRSSGVWSDGSPSSLYAPNGQVQLVGANTVASDSPQAARRRLGSSVIRRCCRRYQRHCENAHVATAPCCAPARGFDLQSRCCVAEAAVEFRKPKNRSLCSLPGSHAPPSPVPVGLRPWRHRLDTGSRCGSFRRLDPGPVTAPPRVMVRNCGTHSRTSPVGQGRGDQISWVVSPPTVAMRACEVDREHLRTPTDRSSFTPSACVPGTGSRWAAAARARCYPAGSPEAPPPPARTPLPSLHNPVTATGEIQGKRGRESKPGPVIKRAVWSVLPT